MQKVSWSVILAGLCLACASCASTPTQNASTPSRVYSSTLADVHQAAIIGFQNLGLDIFRDDANGRYVEGGRKPGYGRGAENVGIFMDPIGEEETRVSIDNRKAIWGMMFAVDWTDQLFQQIDNELNR